MNMRVLLVVDQGTQVFVWVSFLESPNTDGCKVDDEMRVLVHKVL